MGKKLVFDIDLTFLKNILRKVDKIVYFNVVHPMSKLIFNILLFRQVMVRFFFW